MQRVRITIRLEQKIADELRRVAAPRGISAFVNEALRQKLQAEKAQQRREGQEREYSASSSRAQT